MFASQKAPSSIHRGFTGKQLTLGNLRNGSQNDLTCHSFHSLWWAITISRSWLPLVWFASRLQTSMQLLNTMTATVSERRISLLPLLSYEHNVIKVLLYQHIIYVSSALKTPGWNLWFLSSGMHSVTTSGLRDKLHILCRAHKVPDDFVQESRVVNEVVQLHL